VQLSTRTSIGEIGVLANHVPVLARLVPAELRLHLSDSETTRYAQSEGWLEVFANRALVVVREASPPERRVAADLKARLSDAEQRLSEVDEDSAAYRQAEMDRRRTEIFLKIAGGT
jgi:F-type H+-transporting ATPase subunit epsilon